MFDNLLTPGHLVVVLVIGLLIFGPRKLPEPGKGLGEGFRSFKEGIKGTPETPKQDTPEYPCESSPASHSAAVPFPVLLDQAPR